MVGDSEKTYRFLSQIFFKSKIGELGRPIVIFVFPLFFHVMCKGTAMEIGRLIKEGLEKSLTPNTFASHLVASWWEKCNLLLL